MKAWNVMALAIGISILGAAWAAGRMSGSVIRTDRPAEQRAAGHKIELQQNVGRLRPEMRVG